MAFEDILHPVFNAFSAYGILFLLFPTAAQGSFDPGELFIVRALYRCLFGLCVGCLVSLREKDPGTQERVKRRRSFFDGAPIDRMDRARDPRAGEKGADVGPGSSAKDRRSGGGRPAEEEHSEVE